MSERTEYHTIMLLLDMIERKYAGLGNKLSKEQPLAEKEQQLKTIIEDIQAKHKNQYDTLRAMASRL